MKHTMLVETNQHGNQGQALTVRGVLERGVASTLVGQVGVVTQVKRKYSLLRLHQGRHLGVSSRPGRRTTVISSTKAEPRRQV